jgi:tRNA dimethylallyltransferase
MKSDKQLTIIVGPTAVGKTDYSISKALEYDSPIISCDSRQIFKEMKIGTAPPSQEQLQKVRHYFIFSHSVSQYYTAGKYEMEALSLLNKLFKNHDHLVMVGGSGLYVDALCKGLDDFPEADMNLRTNLMERVEKEGIESLADELKTIDPESYETIDTANRQRVVRALEVTITTGKKFSSFKSNTIKERPFNINKVCLVRNREVLYDRINRRVDMMIENGLIEEVESLKKYRNMPSLNTVGYREIFDFLDGMYPLERAVELIKRNTRHFAKRQLTWWRDEKKLELTD